MQGGYQAGARSWHYAHLLENLGLFSEEFGALDDFCLFLLFFFCFHMQYKASILSVHFPKFLQMYTPK